MEFKLAGFRAVEEKAPRIKVLVGEFGSGKTELAVNLALYNQRSGLKTAVIDMDLVKPFFRTREHRAQLEAEGVTVVSPESGLSHADLPVMPTALTQVMFSPEYHVVMDVGGSKSAVVLGQLRHRLMENGCEVLMVINTRRPFSSNLEGVLTAIRNVESVSSLKVTGLVSNTNLGSETTAEHALEGLKTVSAVSNATGLPIRWLVLPEWLYGKVESDAPVLPLQPKTIYPWME